MSWSKPDFVEISLSMEVTAYVNTEAASRVQDARPAVSGATSASKTAALTAER